MSDPFLTKNQLRAKNACECVEKREDKNTEKEYRRLARSFPALIHSSGLVQAIAFVNSKTNEKEKKVIHEYLEHLCLVMRLNPATSEELAKQSREADFTKYQRLTRNAIDSATWLKRYAEALLKDTSDPGGDSP